MGPDPGRDGFEERAARTLRAWAARYEPSARGGEVRATRAGQRAAARRRWVVAAGVLAAVGAITFLVAVVPPRPPVPAASLPTRVTAGTPSPAPLGTTGAPITLATCEITPPDAPLAFAGWVTPDVLGASGGNASPGQPVYALVTRGLAEWVGWQRDGTGPMFPPPIGRMGCQYDPSTGQASIIGVDMAWQAPSVVDGCPASPEGEFGGYREVGGPNAWLVHRSTGLRWSPPSVESYRVLMRLTPPAEPGQTLTSWALPLDAGQPVQGAVGFADTPADGIARTPAAPGSSRYYFVDFDLSRGGCWVVNVQVNGHVVGTAIVSIDGVTSPSVAPQ